MTSRNSVVRREISVRGAVSNFLLDLEISNRATGTIEGSRIVLGFLADFSEEREWPVLRDVTREQIREYLAAVRFRPRWFGKRGKKGVPISDSYYETQFRRIKRWFNWCVKEGYCDDNPLLEIPHPRVPTRVVATVSDDDFRKMLMVSDPALFDSPARKFWAYREQALLWVLIDTPGRREEIARLTVDSVDLTERRILVEGKGRKERYMYLGAVSTQAMAKYKAERDMLSPVTDDWWVDYQGTGLDMTWIYRVLHSICERAGIPPVHPHQFRHTFSIKMIENDVPLPTLEVMGGWERIPKTYLATLGDRAARAAHRRVSPADSIARRR